MFTQHFLWRSWNTLHVEFHLKKKTLLYIFIREEDVLSILSYVRQLACLSGWLKHMITLEERDRLTTTLACRYFGPHLLVWIKTAVPSKYEDFGTFIFYSSKYSFLLPKILLLWRGGLFLCVYNQRDYIFCISFQFLLLHSKFTIWTAVDTFRCIWNHHETIFEAVKLKPHGQPSSVMNYGYKKQGRFTWHDLQQTKR